MFCCAALYLVLLYSYGIYCAPLVPLECKLFSEGLASCAEPHTLPGTSLAPGIAARIEVPRSSGRLIGSIELYPSKVLIQLCDGLLCGGKWCAEPKSRKRLL